jgi:hypothetical protein
MPMEQKEIPGSDKIGILKHVQELQRHELMYRREREFRIFTWSSTILVALIGALLVVRQSETIVLQSYGIWGKVVATLAIVALVFFSVKWQNRQRSFARKNAKSIARMSKLLHCFEEGFFDPKENGALYPKEWANWGKDNSKMITRFFRANKITATTLLGILAVTMIWVS